MSEAKLYYTPPTNEQFEEVKSAAKKLWFEVDPDNDKYGYASEKNRQIENIANVRDNFMYILAMYDVNNQRKLISKLSDDAKEAIRVRLIDGGNDINYLRMVGL